MQEHAEYVVRCIYLSSDMHLSYTVATEKDSDELRRIFVKWEEFDIKPAVSRLGHAVKLTLRALEHRTSR